MSTNTEKLFSYINQTLDLITEKCIPIDMGKDILNKVESQITDVKELYSPVSHMGHDQNGYWSNFIFKNDIHVINYLKILSQKDWHNEALLNSAIDRFLAMPQDVKKEFYQTNLIEHKFDSNNIPYSNMCGKAFTRANPKKTFHNLPTIFLLGGRFEINYDKFNLIYDDIKKTMNISHDEFLDIHGAGIVFCVDNNYLINNWKNFQIDKRVDLQEVVATKFYINNRIKSGSFLENVEKGLLPYDVKLPTGSFHLMNSVISNKINEVNSYLGGYPFRQEIFERKVQETKEFLEDISKKYDLYFLPPKMLEYKAEIISKTFDNHHRNKGGSAVKDTEVVMLDFILSMENIFKKKEDKIEKRIKI
jgi:hypothetical protein